VPDLHRFREWESPKVATTAEVIRQYERGFAGALYSEAAHERFLDGCSVKNGDEVCSLMGYQDTAKGELVVPFRHIIEAYPGSLPGGGQVEGCCVSWGQRNANLLTLVCEAVSGIPDAVSGKVEELPQVSETARKNGVLSNEAIYAFRSTKPGHGWFCDEAARVSQTKAGCVLRKDYGVVNLERYTKETINFWNRRDVSAELLEAFDDHIIREATEVTSFDALRDLLARGFGIQTCGSEGFTHSRDENGVCKRSGSWAHSMAYLGVDDRPWAHEKYGGPLVLIQNSWNEYLSGPRKIYGTDLEIPPGSFWARWKDVTRRRMIAMAGANGWERRKLPDLDPGWS
jgi:hypothetical protein